MNKDINELVKKINSNDLIFIAGRPCTGKTFLSLKLSSEIVKKNNKKVLCLSFDNSPNTLYLHIEKDLNDSYLKENVNIINGIDMKAIIDIKEVIGESKDIGIVIVDYLQLLQHHFNKQENNDTLRELKSIATELNVPIIIISQLGISAEGIKPTEEHLQSSTDLNILDRIIFTYPKYSFYISK